MGVSAASKRVKKALSVIDALELDGEELRELQNALNEREECEIDVGACKTPEDRELAMTLKKRLDAVARGESHTVSIREFIRRGREEVQRVQGARRPRTRASSR